MCTAQPQPPSQVSVLVLLPIRGHRGECVPLSSLLPSVKATQVDDLLTPHRRLEVACPLSVLCGTFVLVIVVRWRDTGASVTLGKVILSSVASVPLTTGEEGRPVRSTGHF